MTIQFLEDIHKYQVVEDPTIELTSVSKLIDMVKIPFDTEKWAKKKADERGITPEEIKKEWQEIKEKSLVKGTKYHKEYEENLLKNKKVHPANYINNIKHSHDLNTLPKGVHPELILYNLRYRITGTADIVEIHDDKSFDLSDHKTNRKLEFTGFKKFDPIFKDRVAVKMKPPLQHLDDCNGMHYTMQLSLYAWMLEQFGYKCNSLTIHHVVFDENDEPCNIIDYPIEYLKKEVTNFLNWYKNKK